MSVAHAKKFFDAVEKDEKLRKEVQKNFGRLADVANKHGFEFKRSEMIQHLRTRWGASKLTSPSGDDPDTCCSSY